MPRILLLFALLFGSATEAADLDSYMTGEVKHLRKITNAYNFHDLDVITEGADQRRTVEKLITKKGKVLLVTFWTRACQHCRVHMRRLIDVQQRMGKERVEAVAINLDGRFPFARVRQELKRRDMDALTAYQDFGGRALAEVLVDPDYDLFGGSPKTLVIDTKGEERFFDNFSLNWTAPESVALLEALLAERPVRPAGDITAGLAATINTSR